MRSVRPGFRKRIEVRQSQAVHDVLDLTRIPKFGEPHRGGAEAPSAARATKNAFDI